MIQAVPFVVRALAHMKWMSLPFPAGGLADAATFTDVFSRPTMRAAQAVRRETLILNPVLRCRPTNAGRSRGVASLSASSQGFRLDNDGILPMERTTSFKHTRPKEGLGSAVRCK